MRIAVPNKGRLHDPSLALLERAGLHVQDGADRKLYANTVDPDVSVLFARAADIPEYVGDGAAALGITGLDQARESGTELVELLDLEFGSCRLVLASPEEDGVSSPEELSGGTVATEFPNVTREYFESVGVNPDIVEVSGATELTPHVDIADGDTLFVPDRRYGQRKMRVVRQDRRAAFGVFGTDSPVVRAPKFGWFVLGEPVDEFGVDVPEAV